MARAVPILMYHRVAPIDESQHLSSHEALRQLTVTPEAFAAQMSWLRRRGYESVRMDELLAHRTGGGVLPRRPVVITFDDGYTECVDYAVPAMQQHGLHGIFFLVSDLVGQASIWDEPEHGWSFPLFNWNTARELETEGFQMGAHTCSHPVLTELSADTLTAEIAGSREKIAAQLGHAVDHFAYTHGALDENVRAAVAEAGFRTACSSRYGRSAASDYLLALKRIEITGFDSFRDFTIRMQGLRPPWVWRRWLRRRLQLLSRQVRKAQADN